MSSSFISFISLVISPPYFWMNLYIPVKLFWGSLAWIPYTKSNGDSLMDFLIVTLSSHTTKGTLESQAFFFSSNSLLMIFNRLFFMDSTCPFPYQWYGEEVDLVMLYLSQDCTNSLELKHISLSVIVFSRHLNLVIIFFNRKSFTTLLVDYIVEIASTNFVK